MQRLYIGCDPGSTGAVALLLGSRVNVVGIPLDPNPIGGTAVDDDALIELARGLAALEPAAFVLEHVWGRKGQGGASQYKFGDTTAAIRVAFKAAGIRSPKPVSSQRWTAALRVGSDKDKHVAEAIRLFPDDVEHFTKRRGVRTWEQCKGNADAALIAFYGRKYNL